MGIQRMVRMGTRRTTWTYAFALMIYVVMMAPVLEASEGKRVAFVVGIGKYDNLGPDKQLKNAVNDVEGVSAKLTEIGFQVVKASNVSRSDFYVKWYEVVESLTEEDTVVFFYSGHGVQIGGQNYLLPRDVRPIHHQQRDRLKHESINLDGLLADLSTGDQPHPKHSVVILDACRDDPFVSPENKSGSTPSGLAKVGSSIGVFVIYSAASNRTALDRLSPNDPVKYSVFTRTLLPLIGRKDLKIQDLGILLKDQVWEIARSAGREQLPTYYDGILGRFCLPGCMNSTHEDALVLQTTVRSTIHPTLPMEITGKDGVPMVLVPTGEFLMGTREVNEHVRNDERPAHPVYLDAYYIDQYEVTTTRYAKFFKETKRTVPKYWAEQVLKQHGRKPVVGISWNDATAYCSWAGKRLPTEAEWEKAARGIEEGIYPWGNTELNQELANFGHCCDFADSGYKVLTDVGSFEKGKSPYGTYDMAGNVWEWTADWYYEHYYVQSPQQNPKGPSSGKSRVIRGGSWNTGPSTVRSTFRLGFPPTNWSGGIGFRCAQDSPK